MQQSSAHTKSLEQRFWGFVTVREMFPRTSLLVLLLLIILPASLSVSGPHIADVNLLLPPRMTNDVEFLLQGSDGCFQWSWDHHDILSIQPMYNISGRCSTSARLRSIAPYGGRKETAIYAFDVRSGTVIRCKVFIDKISRIQIFHNSVKLDLDGLATLRVRAFDSEENVFSSLVGLQFLWKLMPQVDGVPHHLAHVPLKDSPLSDCGGFCGDLNTQIKLEDSGVFSDLYVVKGIGIGHENVSVLLLEPEFEHIEDKIVITVAEAMSIDPPSPVFVIIGASFNYSLKVIRQNIPQAIALPSPYHRWSVLNSSVALVDTMMGLARAVNLGVTTVSVEDMRVSGHVQMSSLHVVLPDTLTLYIVPVVHSGDPVEGIKAIPSVARWYVVAGYQYVIYTKVFSRSGAVEIYITEDDLELHYNQFEHWETFFVPDNISAKHGWRKSRFLKATSQGLGRLTASLTYHSGQPERKEVLKVVQEVMVCNKVTFSMDKINGISQSIHVPWVPGVSQEVELRATGGCAKTSSDYKWFSSDTAIVSVSASGVAQAKKPGQATIKVVSVFDSLNYDEVVVEVSTPLSMVMLQNFSVEVVVGTHLQAAVTMISSNGAYFYRCDAFNSFVKWKVGSESFRIVDEKEELLVLDNLQNFENLKSVYIPICAWTYIYASSAGQAMLHATLSREQYIDQNFDKPSLNAYSLIAAYPPLIVCQAGDGNEFGGYSVDFHQSEASNQWSNLDEIYLVPGTQLDVMLRGGPEQWGQDVEFFETVEILDDKHMHLENGAFVQQAPSNNGKSYKVSCQTLGNYKVVFSRGNLVGDEHPLPAIAKVEVSISCSFPSSITLIANEPVNAPAVIQSATEAERSPEKVRVAPVTVANNCTIRVAAVGIHKSRKAFANSSSLCLKWDLSGCDGLAYWSDADGLGKSGTSWERFLVLHDASGLCILHARVIGFCDTLIGLLSEKTLSLLEDLKNVLTDAIRLQLVSSLRVLPDSVLLFFSPDAKVNLSIAGGTCFLDAIVNDSRVVEVIQPPQSMQCSQLMLGARGLGSSLVTVYDTGVAPPLVASAVVQVADLDWMKIISGEEMSLMEGSTQSINILAGVHDGGAFDTSQYVYMNIRVHIEDPILELLDKDDFSSPGDVEINASNFVIEAKHLGVTLLHVSARQQSGEEIQSQPVKVEVYVPPRISPDDIFLVPGASYVLTLQGGPTIGVLLEYASMDDEVATINKFSGRLSAISPGNTTILATVYGNGNDVICQAYSRIQVGIPSSVILSIQSEQLAVGHEMPIFPSIPEGNLFSFYELCKNYKWTIEDEKVLSFHRPQDSNAHRYEVPFPGDGEINRGYLDEKDYGFINVLFGRSAGRTNIAISFSCEFHSSGYLSKLMSYNVSASVWVISDPPLALGVPITWVLPPFYTTSNILPASHGLYNQWDSHSRKGTVTYSLLRSSDGKNEEMEQHAISIDRGRIRTTESKNLACIQAKDLTTGRIEVASCVRVAEVSQIRLTSEKVPFRVVDLAIGSEVELLISYCDALGIPFYKANDVVPFDADTNYPDTVAINHTRDGNGTLRLKALRHGRALVRISINSIPEKSDYMMISVGARLNPQDPVLHIGHHLNFSLIGSNDLVFGRWLSANESVLSIDMLTGGAKAVGKGVTQVIFKGPDVNLQTTVTVLKANFVLVDAPSETLTNVPFPMKGYNFSVKFRFEAPGHSKGVLYDCRVDPPFVGYAKPWSDLDTGNSYCLFFPFSPEHLVHSIPKSKAMGPEITVSISASLQDSNHVMGSATAFFIGGFSILEISKLDFSSHFNKSTITVVGNTDVEIHWQNRDLMMVTPTRREDFGIGGRAEYEVRVLKPKKFVDKIIISLPATGQRMDIDISYEPGETESSGTWSVALWTGLLGCLSVLILSVASYFWFLDRPHSSDRPIAAAPSVTAPVTPDRSGVIHDSVQSPRTPQPFVEYVRRTIDETPYYRREGRRRFNPQKTY